MTAFLVALGGAIGALVRWVISVWFSPIDLPIRTSSSRRRSPETTAQFPLPTLLANLIACGVIGVVVRLIQAGTGPYFFLAIGLCGGLSTYSTFAVEISALIRARHHGVALAYLIVSLSGGLLIFLLTSSEIL